MSMCMHVCMCACVFAYACAWLCLYACMNACTHAFTTFSCILFLPCYFVYLLLSFHMKDELFRSWETSCSFKKRLTIEARDSSENRTRVCCDLCKLSCECKLESTSTIIKKRKTTDQYNFQRAYAMPFESWPTNTEVHIKNT